MKLADFIMYLVPIAISIIIFISLIGGIADMNATPCIGGYYPMPLVLSKMIIPTSLALLLAATLIIIRSFENEEIPRA